MQLVLARRRADARNFPAEPCPRIPGGLLDVFDANLPFELTAGQQEVGEMIANDLATIHPMNRLLQGEVGSGKTVVALRAMLQVIDSGPAGGDAGADRGAGRPARPVAAGRARSAGSRRRAGRADRRRPRSPCSPGRCRPRPARRRC